MSLGIPSTPNIQGPESYFENGRSVTEGRFPDPEVPFNVDKFHTRIGQDLDWPMAGPDED